MPVLEFPIFDGHPVDVVVTTRAGGVSAGAYESLDLGLHVGDDPDAVVENRRRAAAAVGASLDDLVVANQVHGRAVLHVGTAQRGRGATSLADTVGDVDALVTTDPGIALAMLVADCVPIALYHPDGVLACVHAGWKGTTARIAEATVGLIADLGADPSELLAAIGPAIPRERYQVGEDVAAAVQRCFGGDASDVLVPDGTGRWHLDLRAANRRVLVEADVDPSNVTVADVGTDDHRFFSDRAQRPCGRFAVLGRLRAP